MTRKIIKIANVFLLLLISVTLFAQRTPSKRAEFNYVRLPLSPLNENIKTYDIKPILFNLPAEDSREELTRIISNSFKLHGYQKVESDGDIHFGIALSPFGIKELHPEKTIKKEKQGDKTVDVTYYYYQVELRYPLSLSISDKFKTDYRTREFVNNSNDYSYASTPSFKTTAERTKWWNDNKKKFTQDWKKAQLEANLNSIRRRVESLYAFTPVRVYEPVYTASRRKVDYTDLDKAQEIAVLAYKTINVTDGFGDSFKTQIKEAITIWKNALTQLEPTNKKARINSKVAIALNRNIAVAYNWLTDFDQAEYHVQQEASHSRSKNWSTHFTKQIADRKARVGGGKQDVDDEDDNDEFVEEDDDDEE
jgi:hypothetical protein